MFNFTLLRVISCLLFFCFFLYLYIDKHNAITKLRLKIPPLADDVRELEQEEKRFLYRKARFEDPAHLMELLRKPEFSYLKKPSLDNIEYFTP